MMYDRLTEHRVGNQFQGNLLPLELSGYPIQKESGEFRELWIIGETEQQDVDNEQ